MSVVPWEKMACLGVALDQAPTSNGRPGLRLPASLGAPPGHVALKGFAVTSRAIPSQDAVAGFVPDQGSRTKPGWWRRATRSSRRDAS